MLKKRVDLFCYRYMGIDLANLAEDLNYKPLHVSEPAKELPLKWYEAHPVVGSKILTFHVEVVDDKMMNVVITGNTWLFRDDLERHGVLGSRDGERYFRYLKNIDCTDSDMKQQILSLVDIFRKQNVRVEVSPAAELGSTVSAFLDELSALPQFHFAASSA